MNILICLTCSIEAHSSLYGSGLMYNLIFSTYLYQRRICIKIFLFLHITERRLPLFLGKIRFPPVDSTVSNYSRYILTNRPFSNHW